MGIIDPCGSGGPARVTQTFAVGIAVPSYPKTPGIILWSICCLLWALGAVPAVLAQEGAPVESDPVLTEIQVSGNEKTDLELIHHVMDLQVGQTLNLDQVDDAWDALEDSGYFRFVEMDYDDSEDGQVVLRVTVEEELTTYYGPLLRYSRRHKYLIGGWLEERNLRGKGEVLRVEASAYYIQNGLVSWHRPWLFGVKGLETTLAATGEQADFVYRPTRYRKWDLGLEVVWRLQGNWFVLGGADYGYFRQRDNYSWPLPDRGAGSPTGPALYAAGSENHWVTRLALGFDSRSNPYYPRRGVFAQATAKNWTSGGFANYLQTELDARVFIPLPIRKHTLALRGWRRDTDGPVGNIDNGMYFGGPETVRGYPYAQREGDQGYLLSAEYRIPLFLMPISPKGELVGFGFHLFTDAGDAWFDGAEAGRSMFSYGVGAHVNLDTWNFRFEAARTREGAWMFEFMDRFNF
jgi:outer membrane protein assembly factor BamA